jgi:hypothetical protein
MTPPPLTLTPAPRQSEQVSVFFGLAMLLGKPVTNWSLSRFGAHGHTSRAHLAEVVGGLLIALLGSEASLWARLVGAGLCKLKLKLKLNCAVS